MPIFSWEGRVYWSETDAAQIAHFSTFFRYCEATEEELLQSAAGVKWEPGKPMFPRVHASCDYYAPLRVHDRYRVDVVGIEVGEKSITYEYEVHNLDLGVLAARCKIVTVAVDPSSFKPVKVPREVEEALLKLGARKRGERGSNGPR
ncbi:MAG: thioesterase family protein [Thermoproteota archaeon]